MNNSDAEQIKTLHEKNIKGEGKKQACMKTAN